MEEKCKLQMPALVVMVLTVVITIGKFAQWFQIKWQLISPLIHENTIELIRRPFFISGVFGVVLIIPTFLFYKKKKYKLSIVLSVINYLLQACIVLLFSA